MLPPFHLHSNFKILNSVSKMQKRGSSFNKILSRCLTFKTFFMKGKNRCIFVFEFCLLVSVWALVFSASYLHSEWYFPWKSPASHFFQQITRIVKLLQ